MKKFTKNTKRRVRKQKRNNFNYVQYKINKLSSYTKIIDKNVRKRIYTIEAVLTAYSESCTAYLLIEKRTGPI